MFKFESSMHINEDMLYITPQDLTAVAMDNLNKSPKKVSLNAHTVKRN